MEGGLINLLALIRIGAEEGVMSVAAFHVLAIWKWRWPWRDTITVLLQANRDLCWKHLYHAADLLLTIA